MSQILISHPHEKLVAPFRPDLQNLFPEAPIITWNNERKLVLPHDLAETRMLRNLDFPVPAPISEHYGFPGHKRPFEVQVKTAAVMTMNPRCFILNGMGTGKTRSALWAYDWLHAKGHVKKMLVVAPVSTLQFVWAREAIDTLHGVRVKILYGSKEQRLKRLDEDADIYIINHDGVGVILEELNMRRDIQIICFDEAAKYRNARSKVSKQAAELLFMREWGWAMTGSPTPTYPSDAYGLARLMIPNSAPRSFTFFRQETMVNVHGFKWVPRKEAAEIVAKVLQPAVRFSLDDVLELPPVIERTIDVPQGTRQRGIYHEIKQFAAAELREGRITASNGGVIYMKLRQVSCGYVYTDGKGEAVLDNEARLEALLNLIENTEGKCIVFSPFIQSARGVHEFLKKEKIDVATVTGATSIKDRTAIFNLFQNTTRYRVLNAHPMCMAHGLTLTAADTVCWFAPVDSLEIFEQANARIRRIGQKHKQQIIMLQGTTVERQAYERLRNRRDLQENVLDLLREIASE